ncbi:DNA topoisomerase iii [Echinococcus multilocularis]|uniref:Prokaryotic DNA topoisomerase n=1 Tax=Echinococcus multilocularis TaxID=6211 RepID=A0A068YE90_ECHMU|nr:DNA topoisomerase iii [Echinococcus multilocularis]
MSNNLHEFQNHDSSFYGDAIEELRTEEKLKGRRFSSYFEYVKTEQGDHQTADIGNDLVEESLNESKSTPNNLRSSSSSNIPDIDSTVEKEKDESTVVASITSKIEELDDDSKASLDPPASVASNAWSEESLVTKSDHKEAILQKQKSSAPRSNPSDPTTWNLQVWRTSRTKGIGAGGTSISVSRHRYSTASSAFCRSPPPSTFGSCLHYNSNTGRTGSCVESELGVTELAEALHQLSRDARFRSIRPLWRDPNSRLLPSDETASVEAMLREYNHLLLAAATNANTSSSSTSQLAVRRPYHSTLNRWRQQERIQMENFILANRLRNIRPSPETSREVLLKHYKEYFITPVTAQSLTKGSALDLDASLPRSRPRCSSARSVQLGPPRPLKRLTGFGSAHTTPAPSHTSVCGCALASGGSVIETPRSREVLGSLNSVRRAIHEQRVKGKL